MGIPSHCPEAPEKATSVPEYSTTCLFWAVGCWGLAGAIDQGYNLRPCIALGAGRAFSIKDWGAISIGLYPTLKIPIGEADTW